MTLLVQPISFKWLKALCFFILCAYVDSSQWPLQTLLFNSVGEGVTVEMKVKAIRDLTDTAMMTCTENLTWSLREELLFADGLHHFNATDTLSEGSHAVCMIDDIIFLNLSVPCLFRNGVPKPHISSLSSRTNCLSIYWEFDVTLVEEEQFEIYCSDSSVRTSKLVNATVRATASAELCGHFASDLVYCCVRANFKLKNNSFITCDCQHITLNEPIQPKLAVGRIIAQPADKNICVEIVWEFTGKQVLNAGVCCSPNHLLHYEICNITAADCHLKHFNRSWCGTYGQGNYYLYCYALNEYYSNEGVRVAKSSVYSSSIDGPRITDISYSFPPTVNQTCLLLNWSIPKSFYSLQKYHLRCETTGNRIIDNENQFLMSSYNFQSMSLTDCLPYKSGNASLTCELKNYFHPNYEVLEIIKVTVPVRIWALGFLAVKKYDTWATKKSFCFKVDWAANNDLEGTAVKECCVKSNNLQGNHFCNETGQSLCIGAFLIWPRASCYVETDGVTSQRSDFISKLLFGTPRLAGINITTTHLRSYSPLLELDEKVLDNEDMTCVIKGVTPTVPFTFGKYTKLHFSTANKTLQWHLTIEVWGMGIGYMYKLIFPPYQELKNVSVTKMIHPSQICMKFTWANLNTPLDFVNISIEYVGTYSISCKNMMTMVDTNFENTPFENHTVADHLYSSHELCFGSEESGHVLQCYIKAEYYDSDHWMIALANSSRIDILLTCGQPSHLELSMEYYDFIYNESTNIIQVIYNISWTAEHNCFSWRKNNPYELLVGDKTCNLIYTNDSTLLYSFEANTSYVIELYAYNSDGRFSMASRRIQTISPAPKNVQTTALGLACVNVSWQSPDLLNGSISYYQVSCSPGESPLNVTERFGVVCNLKPFTSTLCKVTALTPDVQSPPGLSDTFISACNRPERVDDAQVKSAVSISKSVKLISFVWNITWQPVLHNCGSLKYYNVTVIGDGGVFAQTTSDPQFNFRVAQVNINCTIIIYAVNNEGLVGDMSMTSVIFREEVPINAPMISFNQENSSCVTMSILNSSYENSTVRFIDVECVMLEDNRTIFNLTVEKAVLSPIPACMLKQSGTVACNVALGNFAGRSPRAYAVYKFMEKLTTETEAIAATAESTIYKDNQLSSTKDSYSVESLTDSEYEKTSEYTVINEAKDTLTTTATNTGVMKSSFGNQEATTYFFQNASSGQTPLVERASYQQANKSYQSSITERSTDATTDIEQVTSEDDSEKLENSTMTRENCLAVVLLSLSLVLM